MVVLAANGVTPLACRTAAEEMTVHGDAIEEKVNHGAFRETID